MKNRYSHRADSTGFDLLTDLSQVGVPSVQSSVFPL